MTTAPFARPETDLAAIDLSQRSVFRQGFPHDLFTTLRRDAPVWWHPATPGCAKETEGRGFWILSRHADIQAVSRDAQRFSAEDGPTLTGLQGRAGLMLVDMDGARHVQQRKLISAGFTPRMTKRLEDQARTWAVRILEDALERGSCNFVEDIAYPLPMHMIADIVGIPTSDRAWLFALISDFLLCADPEHPVPTERRDEIGLEIFQYGHQLRDAKRKAPQDDVWTRLTEVEVETADGEQSRLSELELDAFFVLLTIAGSETTRNAISLGMQALLDDPAQLEMLRKDPGLLKTATEEIIRWASPVSYFRRTVRADTELRGVPLAAGDRVTLWYPSGNRDEAVFDDPFRFDVRREPNEQVSFGGGGAHFCLGAHLARREITILFEELLARVDKIERLGEATYSVLGIANPISVSLKDLPVRLTAR